MHDMSIAVKKSQRRNKTILVTYFIQYLLYLLRGICTKAISLESCYLTLANFPCYMLDGSQNSLKETNILITFVFMACLSQ